MVQRCLQIAFMLMVTSLLVLAGCAKMLTTSDTSAPGAGGYSDSGRSSDGGRAADGGRSSATGQMPGGSARPDPKEFVATAVLQDIHFEFDRYEIRPEDARVLEANAESLKSNPNWRVLIEGHADQRGTTEYNIVLGDRRAKASMNYLVAQGVRASRISVISYGEGKPLCEQSSEGCWSQNRRAHFLVKER
jgi:peptidoglycan-associated lipoprotein